MNTYHSKFNIKSISKIEPNFKVLEEKFHTSAFDYNLFSIKKIQSYYPILELFTTLEESNYNNTTLNHKYQFLSLNSVFDTNIAKDNGSNTGYAGSAGWFRAYGTGSTMNCDLINNTYANNINTGTATGLNNFNRSAVGMGKTNGTFNGNVANCIFWKNTTTGGAVSKSIAEVHTTLGQNITVKNSIGEDSFSNLPSGRPNLKSFTSLSR